MIFEFLFIPEKNGINPSEVCDVSKYVIDECKNLNFCGLMTIGMLGYDSSQGPNPDFLSLFECREKVCKELSLDHKDVQLSMGMSGDFEHAVCGIVEINILHCFWYIVLCFRLNLEAQM